MQTLKSPFSSDVAPAFRRLLLVSWLFASFGPGFAIGPLLGGIGASQSYAFVFGISGMAALAAGVATLFLRETVVIEQSAIPQPRGRNAWQDPRVLLLGALTFSIW